MANKKGGKKHIKETKCTCMACGNVWYYGKADVQQNKADNCQNCGAILGNCGTGMLCCSGCIPAIFIPKEQIKQVKDFNKCAKCNSTAVKKEEVIHEV